MEFLKNIGVGLLLTPIVLSLLFGFGLDNTFRELTDFGGGVSYKKDKPFRAWIYQIARNVNSDHFRKQKAQFSDWL